MAGESEESGTHITACYDVATPIYFTVLSVMLSLTINIWLRKKRMENLVAGRNTTMSCKRTKKSDSVRYNVIGWLAVLLCIKDLTAWIYAFVRIAVKAIMATNVLSSIRCVLAGELNSVALLQGCTGYMSFHSIWLQYIRYRTHMQCSLCN